MRNKKILVTGGAGAVGTNLINALLQRDNKVTSWDNYSVGKESNHINNQGDAYGCNYLRIDTNEAAQALR